MSRTGQASILRRTLPRQLQLIRGSARIVRASCIVFATRRRVSRPDGDERGEPPGRSARRADPDLESVEVRTAERASGVSDDSRRKKAQACAPGRRFDDDDQSPAFDCRDPEAFRSGQVEVAFE